MIPPDFRAAIERVGFAACRYCGLAEVVADELRERPRACHPLADCLIYLHPDSAEAVAMAEAIDAEIGRHLLLGMYCDDEDLPVHAWGGAP